MRLPAGYSGVGCTAMRHQLHAAAAWCVDPPIATLCALCARRSLRAECGRRASLRVCRMRLPELAAEVPSCALSNVQ